MDLFDKNFYAIQKKMDLHFKRHMILSGNVANNETPNYRTRELDFAGELQKALGTRQEPLNKTHPGHMDLVSQQRSRVVVDNKTPVGADGNNVDLDIAMGKLSSNARGYTGAGTLLQMKLRMLRMAARGRGGF